ncbi:acyltransferase [Candidatus Woesebacteria bacterium]|nr:acyltransferase [Candidatus Woesebacteria bacterium]
MKHLTDDHALRALAICCVVLIHILSSIQPSPFVEGSKFQMLAVTVDQLSRISVPLFVSLSGLALQQKYGTGGVSWPNFWWKRLRRVLPGYLLWSVIFTLTFLLVPAWKSSQLQPGFLLQLLLGRADYHLYFVPMIVQFYLLFPLLRLLHAKAPRLLLLGSIVGQVMWYWVYSYQSRPVVVSDVFLNDSEQYIWSMNWIWFFVLGMNLAQINQWLKRRTVFGVFLLVIACLTGIWGAVEAVHAINNGTDPLIALRFTRYPVLLYATTAIVALTWSMTYCRWKSTLSKWLSRYSYSIYLSHTLWLRLVFSILYR